MIDLETLRRAAELAHDQHYGAALKLLQRPLQVQFMEEDDCMACRLGGLTREEWKAVHAEP